MILVSVLTASSRNTSAIVFIWGYNLKDVCILGDGGCVWSFGGGVDFFVHSYDLFGVI